MPRIEVIAQWKDSNSGDIYVSMISSLGVTGSDPSEYAHRLYDAIEDAAGYERGPITDMAINQRTGVSRYNEKKT